MKYLSYIVWILILVLSVFFYNEYMAEHAYYYRFLWDLWNWWTIIFAIFASLMPALYLMLKSNKTWKWIISSFLVWFAIFALVLWIAKDWIVSIWYFTYLLNFLILFVFFTTIIVWATSLWDLILKKIKFQETVYDYSIKTWVWIAVLWIILYYLTILWFVNIFFAYVVLAWLIWLIFYRKDSLKNIFWWLLDSLEKFNYNIKSINFYTTYAFIAIFALVFLYIYFWFSYSFIPYPSAWDANHAYMFYPKVFAEYGGYPWITDFRPDLSIWTAFLAWVFNLWFFTWFSQDTWMITFNFTSWIFSIFFGFMLITTIVKLVYNTKDMKHYILLILGYVLLLTWLTSWMWAFLVFVDNKTDLAVFMFIVLALFLAIYSLLKQEWAHTYQDDKDYAEFDDIKENTNQDTIDDKQNNESTQKDYTYVFFMISWFLFAIANVIKPTATFDFFQTAIIFSILNVWVLAVLWWLLFVVWLLYYLKFRGFDKLFSSFWETISNFLWKASMIYWVLLWIFSLAIKIRKNKTKIISLFIFIGSFFWTLILIKWPFWIAQYIHDWNLNSNPWEIATSLLMSNKLPTVNQEKEVGSLYEWLEQNTWDAYNEDNWRYVWYGDKKFYNPWWSFIIPSNFKNDYIIYFNEQDYKNSNYEPKLYLFSWSSIIQDNIINKYSIEIFNNKNNSAYERQIIANVDNAEQNWQLLSLAKQLWLNLTENDPSWKVRKDVISALTENTKKQLLKDIKQKFASWNLTLSSYPQILQTKENAKLLNKLSTAYVNYSVVSIPYKYLVPFNVVFNWSLQNESSYYTDIGIVWLLLFIITIFALIYSIFKKDKILWWFAFATIVGWSIWYGVASWIVWYNIWWIIWLIIVTILFVNRLKDRLLLAYVLLGISIVWIWLNLFRITTQWWEATQFWYKSSVWKQFDYQITSEWLIKWAQDIKIPYNKDDIFSLQFNFYKKAIDYFNNRKAEEAWIIWWTYMRYFVKNQDSIIDDQFLIRLYKWFSDDNVDKAYERLKDQNITWIVIDPNIASVVMWEWNKSLWYRYYGYTDENTNITKKWVMPMFVDLAQSWNLEYVYSNNLWLKYALTVSDEDLKKATWIEDGKKLLELRYKLTSIKFLPSMLWIQAYQEAMNAFYQILVYRAKNYPVNFVEDIAEVNWLNIYDVEYIFANVNKNFNKLTKDEKTVFLQYYNISTQLNENPKNSQKILQELVEQWIWGRAQLLFVKIK